MAKEEVELQCKRITYSSTKSANEVLAAFEKETASHGRQSVPFPRLVEECTTKQAFEDLIKNLVGDLGFMFVFPCLFTAIHIYCLVTGNSAR